MNLITGINGFIGSQIARLLILQGKKVRGLVRKASDLSNLKDIQSNIELVEGDILNADSLNEAFKNVKICYHTAALVKADGHTKKEYYSTNLQGTINVCKEAMHAKVEKFVHTSSCETLRQKNNFTIITEEEKNKFSDMMDDYGRSKFLAEEHVKACIAYDLPVIVVNPTAVIGPGDVNLTPPGSLMLAYCKGKVPAYFETGFNIVDVRDVATGHLKAAEKGEIGKRYLLEGSNILLSELFAMLRKITNKKPLTLKIPYWLVINSFKLLPKKPVSIEKIKASKHPLFFDGSKTGRELAWEPAYKLETTLKDAWEWYQKI